MTLVESSNRRQPWLQRIRHRFLRITTGGDYLPEVDGIRCFAIGLVLLQHMYERVSRRAHGYYPEDAQAPAGWLFSQGDFGVQLFFALSGFILFRGLCRMAENGSSYGTNYGRYLWRRVTRLEPPYLLVMTGILLFLTLTGYQSGFSKSSQAGQQTLTQSFAASLAYSHTIIFGAFPKLNPPSWSLETEFQFYLLAPLLVWPLRRHLGNPWARMFTLSVLIAALLALAVPFAYDIKHLRYSLAVYLPLFLVGFLTGELSEWLSRKWPGNARDRLILDGIGVVSSAVLLRTAYPGGGRWSGLVYCGLLLGLLVGCISGRLLPRLLSWGMFPVVGGMCYSLYLIHLPLMEVIGDLTHVMGRGLAYPVYVGIQGLLLISGTLAAGTVFYLLVEQPCMDREWPARLWRKLIRAKPD